MAIVIFNDTNIDNLVWNAIAQSDFCKDCEAYIELFSQGIHLGKACSQIERLLHTHQDQKIASAYFVDAFAELAKLAHNKHHLW